MKRSTILTAVTTMFLLAFLPITAKAQNITQPYIDINSTATREVTPDEIYLRITIKESDYKGKKSLEEMQEAMLGALKINRIDIPECLTLNYMGSDVSYKIFSKNINTRTEATYTLKLHDVATMQNVISALEERQISNIDLVKTKFTKEKELKHELAIEAMQQAQAEARTLAGAIGQEIGKALSINYWMNSNDSQPRLYKSRANMVMDESAVAGAGQQAPTFGIGKITYSLNVNVKFELK
ncbi:MAG: SIMPL domain-containing protein [Bacteroidaceae bacterium]|nr:SIMPL domain-containing protein [Bacteroidaceae bacterium]